jgi:hypothetical protein
MLAHSNTYERGCIKALLSGIWAYSTRLYTVCCCLSCYSCGSSSITVTVLCCNRTFELLRCIGLVETPVRIYISTFMHRLQERGGRRFATLTHSSLNTEFAIAGDYGFAFSSQQAKLRHHKPILCTRCCRPCSSGGRGPCRCGCPNCGSAFRCCTLHVPGSMWQKCSTSPLHDTAALYPCGTMTLSSVSLCIS